MKFAGWLAVGDASFLKLRALIAFTSCWWLGFGVRFIWVLERSMFTSRFSRFPRGLLGFGKSFERGWKVCASLSVKNQQQAGLKLVNAEYQFAGDACDGFRHAFKGL